MLVSAWLPASHGGYLAPFDADVRKLTVLYEPYCLWGVPEYVPEDDVGEVSDLLRGPAIERMERLIQGINPGAGISRFSAAIVEQYGLSTAGYTFATGTEAQCFERYVAAVADRRWVVVPLWQPHWLHHRYRIRELREPRGLLGGTDAATLIVRKDAEQLIGAAALAELATLHLGQRSGQRTRRPPAALSVTRAAAPATPPSAPLLRAAGLSARSVARRAATPRCGRSAR